MSGRCDTARWAAATAVALLALLVLSAVAAPEARAAAAKAPGAPAAPPPPTAGQIRDLFERREDAEVIKALARVLALKGDEAKGYDRHELLRLKGETHLRMRAARPAAEAFAAAAAAAPDARARAQAEAMGLLLKRARNFTYTPKPGRKARGGGGEAEAAGPFDLLDPARREAAFKALYAQELAAARPAVKAALRGRSVTDIAGAIRLLGELRSLELVATGGHEETDDMVRDLADRATDLMRAAVNRMERRVLQIDQLANQVVEHRVPVQESGVGGVYRYRTGLRKRGLVGGDMAELKNAVETCAQVVPAARGLAELDEDRRGELRDIAVKALEVGRLAADTLGGRYAREAAP